MLHRKLLEILQRFTPDELKKLRLFICSPYFNSSNHSLELLKLFDRIMEYGGDENHPALAKETVFREFFPNKVFQENSKTPLDSLSSELFGLVRRFLTQSDLEQENGAVSEFLAQARFYRKFGLEERFWQTMKSLRQHQVESHKLDAQHYFEQFKIEEEEMSFRSLYDLLENDGSLNAIHTNFDRFYGIIKMGYACLGLYKNAPIDPKSFKDEQLLNSILTAHEPNPVLDIPLIRIYRLVYHLIKEPENENALDELGALFQSYETYISTERAQEISTYIRVLWVKKYHRKGDSESRNQVFEIYREHLEKGYFYLDGLLPLPAFRNLIIFALKLGKYEWVKQFLESHPPSRISGTKYPEEAHRLNFAEYYFYLKNYDEAQQTLVYRLFEAAPLSLAADLLLLKIYYETQNDLLETRIKAMDQKVRRAKIAQTTRNQYLNFLSALNKIIKYAWKPDKKKHEKLLEEIKTEPELISREWLLEQLSKLK